jgi:hypothetical protein
MYRQTFYIALIMALAACRGDTTAIEPAPLSPVARTSDADVRPAHERRLQLREGMSRFQSFEAGAEIHSALVVADL